MLELVPGFAAQLPPGIDAFDDIMGLDGELFREMDDHRTLRATLSEDGKFWSRCHLRACSLYHSFCHERPATL